MNIFKPYWAKKRIKELNPETDYQEITHLAFEVRYASPIFTHALFSVAFARQVAVPSIAKVLYRNGKGAIITNTRKRNNDTLLFFGEFFKHGVNPKGLDVIHKLNSIHSHFPITNEQNLYTIATLMCEPIRMSIFLTGKSVFSDKETRAVYLFWKEIGKHMGIHDFSQDENTMLQFYADFELKQFAYSEDGRKVVEALAAEFAERWYPKFLKDFGMQIYYSLFDEALLSAFKLDKPSILFRLQVRFYLWFYLSVWAKVKPDPKDRSIIDFFNTDYNQYDIAKVGPANE